MSPEDKDLLEMAAKAAGVDLKPMEVHNVSLHGNCKFIGFMSPVDQWPRGWFDPLSDSGDAFRLAVRCGVSFRVDYEYPFGDRVIEVGCTFGETMYGDAEICGNDPEASARLVIVRIAAAVGRDLP